MFVFEMRVMNRPEADNIPALEVDEFQFALVLRILKLRNRELHNKFNDYYEKVSERSQS